MEAEDPGTGSLFVRFPRTGEGGARVREVGGAVGEGKRHGSSTPDQCVLRDPQARSGNIALFDLG